MQLERSGVRRRLLVLVPIAVIAVVAAACLPPAPPPPPPTTTTQPPTTTTTRPSFCDASPATVSTSEASGFADASGRPNHYIAVVERDGRSEVLTRQASSAAELAQFRADAAAQGEVTAFEADGEVHSLAETPTWGFLDSGFTAAWGASSSTGGGVRVAVLDTGVDTCHPDLTGHFDGPSADIVSSSDKAHPVADTTDPSTSGHGTHVSGIVAATAGNGVGVEGGAPGVTLVPVRVLGVNGSGSYSDVAAGIYWAADVSKGNADVITMSLGGTSTSDAVTTAIADVENPANTNYSHPVITVAAGNSSGSDPSFPGSLASTTPEMLSVSALCKVGTTDSCPSATTWPADLPYKLATYSSFAWSGSDTATGISAPGTNINSSVPKAVNVSGYKLLSGTSMATPFVAAAAALVRQYCPSDSAAQVVSRLENTADDLGAPGVDKLFGYGKLDVAEAVASC